MTIEKIALVIIFVCTLAIAGLLLIPRAGADESPRLELAQCILAENDFADETDAAAIAHVLRKRAARRGMTLRAMTLDYCAIFKKTDAKYYGTRPDIIRKSTLTEPPRPAKCWDCYEKRWPAVLAFVDRFLAGRVTDPCPRCMHWAGRTDEVPANWTCPVKVLNTFCYVQR